MMNFIDNVPNGSVVHHNEMYKMYFLNIVAKGFKLNFLAYVPNGSLCTIITSLKNLFARTKCFLGNKSEIYLFWNIDLFPL